MKSDFEMIFNSNCDQFLRAFSKCEFTIIKLTWNMKTAGNSTRILPFVIVSNVKQINGIFAQSFFNLKKLVSLRVIGHTEKS